MSILTPTLIANHYIGQKDIILQRDIPTVPITK